MSYDELRSYLHQLRADTERKDIRVDWDVINPDRVKAVNHDQLAGLQLADAVATSIYYAVTPSFYGDIEDRYLQLIARNIYRHEHRVEGYGLKFWCTEREVIERVLRAVALG